MEICGEGSSRLGLWLFNVAVGAGGCRVGCVGSNGLGDWEERLYAELLLFFI